MGDRQADNAGADDGDLGFLEWQGAVEGEAVDWDMGTFPDSALGFLVTC